MLLPTIDLVNDQNLIWIFLKLSRDLDVVESFFLKVFDKVALPLIHQVSIYAALRVDGYQFLPLAACKQRKPAQLRALRPNRHDRSYLDFEGDIDSIVLRNILRRILLDAAGQPVLFRKYPFHLRGRGGDPARGIRLTGLKQGS